MIDELKSVPTKRTAKTSKALAKLAADYLNLTKEELLYKSVVSPGKVIADIRKLAASVLRQAESSEVRK